MPRMHRETTVFCGKALAHDADGKLYNMQVQARACVFGAQFLQPPDPSNPVYRSNMERAIAIAKNEREGWCAIKTQAFPDGDYVGAGKASMFISGLHMELDEFMAALRWCVQAARDFRKASSAYDTLLNANVDFVLLHIEDERNVHYLKRSFDSWAACASENKREDTRAESIAA